ncbi:MAG: hypothetical protein J6I85_00280 [Clostridia bacterium]|nr:hypothetical protein [Clostridia bacterium]
MIKKLVALFSTMILMFSVVFPIISKAAEEKVYEPETDEYNPNSSYGTHGKMNDYGYENAEDAMDVLNGGRAKIGDTNQYAGFDISDDTVNSILKNAIKIFNIVPTLVRGALTLITHDERDEDPTYVDDYGFGTEFTIERTVFGKIRLFDVNFLHRDADEPAISGAIKNQVAKFYYITRNISIGFMLLVLIYTGIRMAMSTLASQIAKYKTMIKDWIVALIILMTMQYFMAIILHVGTITTNLCQNVLDSIVDDSDEYKIEEKMLNQAMDSTNKGWSLVIPTLLYWILTYYQVKFLLMYFSRLVTMAFLVTIAPFVTVSYSLDKAGDGQAQALKTWLSEFAMGVMIQPLHAFIYMIFMVMASKIMNAAPILSIVFINYLDKAEKIVRSIFRLENGIVIAGMKEVQVKAPSKEKEE